MPEDDVTGTLGLDGAVIVTLVTTEVAVLTHPVGCFRLQAVLNAVIDFIIIMAGYGKRRKNKLVIQHRRMQHILRHATKLECPGLLYGFIDGDRPVNPDGL